MRMWSYLVTTPATQTLTPTDRVRSASHLMVSWWQSVRTRRSTCSVCWPARCWLPLWSLTGYTHTVRSALNCKSENAIYLWRCIKCGHNFTINTGNNNNTTTLPDINNMQGTTYFGMRRFALRMAEHRNYAKSNNVAESSGEHFNLASIISRVW